MRRVLTLGVAAAALLGTSLITAPTASAMYSDVFTAGDSTELTSCPGKPHAGAKAFVQTRIGDGQWVNRTPLTVARNGCVGAYLYPASLASAGTGQISIRLAAPAQRIKGKTVRAWQDTETAYRVWPTPTSGRDAIPHLDAFAVKNQDTVATILCYSPRGGGSQGTGFRVPVNLHPEAVALGRGGTFLVTAGHVVDDCFLTGHRDVTVVYKGQNYTGYVWNKWASPDIATIITDAPIVAVELARGARPQIGDSGASIGTAGGVISTTTQGTINGVSDSELNTTIPSGHGASGGPVYNNRGQVIGIITGGNGSLTVVTALPAFCDTVYAPAWCATPIW